MPAVASGIPAKEKKRYEIIVALTTVAMVLAWFVVLYLFRSKLIHSQYKLVASVTALIPIVFILYHGVHRYNLIKDARDLQEEKKKIRAEMEAEQALAKVIPVLIFGLGIVLERFDKKYLGIAIPFLLLALLFGTVIPYMIIYVNFEESHIYKLLASETVQYSSEAYSFGLLLSGIILPFLYFYEKEE